MSKTYDNIPKWIQGRILEFLNGAKDAAEIVNTVRDDPEREGGGENKDYAIGEKVAQNIIDARNALPGRRFRELSQVDGAPGVGEDKLNDLAYSFSQTADEAFRERMYDGVISENNFALDFRSTTVEDPEEFERIVAHDSMFAEIVGELVEGWVAERTSNRLLAQTANRYLQECHLETDTGEAFVASRYFAYWFFKFDADNWFGFDQVQQETEAYLSYNTSYNDRLELRFFKGFHNGGLLADAISPDDLPVVVNWGEQKITIWRGSLAD